MSATGLPNHERLIAAFMLKHIFGRFLKWDAVTQKFVESAQNLLYFYDTIPEDWLTRPTKIKRLPGIEEVSTTWSPAMTLEHINIVGRSIQDILKHQKKGKPYTQPIRIAAVKPHENCDPVEVRKAFAAYLEEYADFASQEIVSPLKIAHPWFGPLTAKQWHTLSFLHLGLHFQQLQRIVKGLNTPGVEPS